jgi:hypothetical protein
MSCRKETSPTTRVVGLFRPAAKPAAVLSTPSMPLAPLLDPTETPTPTSKTPWHGLEPELWTLAGVYEVLAWAFEHCRCQVAYMSISRTGMLLPMNSPLPAKRMKQFGNNPEKLICHGPAQLHSYKHVRVVAISQTGVGTWQLSAHLMAAALKWFWPQKARSDAGHG